MSRTAIMPGLPLVVGLSCLFVLTANDAESRAAPSLPARESHLLLNGDFEKTSPINQGLPQGWLWTFSPGSKVLGSLDSTVTHGGKFSFRLRNPEPIPGTFSWLTQILPTLEPNTEYGLSFWAKAEENSGGWVAIESCDADRKSRREVVPLREPTFDWREYTFKFNSGEDVQWTILICADGKVRNLWLDDMALTRLSPKRVSSSGAAKPSLTPHFDNFVHVKDFAAAGDRVTDDTGAIQSALDSLGVRGGTVLLGHGRYLVGTIVIPENVGLLGDLLSPEEQYDMANVQQRDYYEVGSQLCLKAGCSVLMRRCSSLQNCLVIRAGLPLSPANDAESTKLVNSFSGKGVIANETGTLVRNCLILGFDTAISSAGLSGGSGKGRIIIDHCRIDANNGINLYTSGDVSHFDQVHCWPFLTASVPGVTGKNLHRKGTGILLRNGCDWSQVSNSFCYGYKTDFACEDASAVSFLHCQADYGGPDENAVGFAVTGRSELIAVLGCTVITQRTGVLIEASGRTGGFSNNVRIEGCTFANTTSIDVRKGAVVAMGNTFNRSGVGIQTGSEADPAILIGNCFDECGTPLSLDKRTQAKSTALGNNYVRCTSPVGAIFNAPVVYPTYAVAELPTAANAGAGATVFVRDAPSGAGLAVSDGASWHLLTGKLLPVRPR